MTIIHKKIITFVVLLGLFSAYQIGLSNASDYDSIVKTFLGDSQLDYHYNKKLTITNDMDKELTLSANFSDNLPAYSYIGSGKLISPDGQMNILPGESKTFTLYLDPSMSVHGSFSSRYGTLESIYFHVPLISLHLSQPKEFNYQRSCWIATSWHTMNDKEELDQSSIYARHQGASFLVPEWAIYNQYAYLKYTGKALRETQNQYIMSSPDGKKLAPQVKNEDVTLTIERCDDAGKNTLTIQNNTLNQPIKNLTTVDRTTLFSSIFENALPFFKGLPHLAPLTNYTLYLKKNGDKNNFFATGTLPQSGRFSFSFYDINNNFHNINLTLPGGKAIAMFGILTPYFHSLTVFYDDGSIFDQASKKFKKWSDIGIPNFYSQQVVGVTTLKSQPKKLYFFLNNGKYFSYDTRTQSIDQGYPKDTAANWGMSKDEAKIITGVTLGMQQDPNAPTFLLRNGLLLYANTTGDKIVGNYNLFHSTFSIPWLRVIGADLQNLMGFINPLSTTKTDYTIQLNNGSSVTYVNCKPNDPKVGCIYPQHGSRFNNSFPGQVTTKATCKDNSAKKPWSCSITQSTDMQHIKHMNLSLAPSRSQALANWPMLYRHFE